MRSWWIGIGAVLSMWLGFAQVPQISSLSASSLPRSGRLRILGANFGAASASSYVTIGGVRCWTTRWSDTAITAYVPESLPIGTHPVQVVTSAGASNTVLLQVTARVRQGRVLWRFQADADYIYHRPAVGPDGTLVVHDSRGYVYALSPEGGLKWIHLAGVPYGPPSIGADGTVYVGTGATVKALNPTNGSLRWQFTDTVGGGLWIIAGPTVGPDGNIYVATETASGVGLGVFSLTPAGQLRWSHRGNPPVFDHGSVGVEIVFGPSRAGRPIDQLYVAFDERGTGVSSLYAFRMSGGQQWAVPSGGQSQSVFMQRQCQPAVGPDGTVYITTFSSSAGHQLNAFNPENGAVRWRYTPPVGNDVSAPDVGSDGVIYFAHGLSYLSAVNPNGTLRWSVSDGSILQYPIVSPNNQLIVTGGQPQLGTPGFVRGYSTQNGQLLWQVDLGSENGGNQVLYSRPRFSRDSSVVYFGTTLLGQSSTDPYCYLYAVYTGNWVEGDVDGNGCVDDADLLQVLFAFGCSTGCGSEDVNGDGTVDDADLLMVLFNFGSGC
ncbi:Desiccation/radiation resistance protein [bacterium HR15]|nr:Desiccation/radiation resistance protein [bacterium HR15]